MFTPIRLGHVTPDHVTGAPAAALASLSLAGPEDPIMAMADAARDSRILVVSPGALDLACNLLHRGYQTATIVRVDDCLPAHQADIVIIPRPATPDFIERAIPFARRMLAPMGVVALRLAPAPANDASWARRQLLLNGFTAIRVDTAQGETLIGAELPLHNRGALACA